MPTFSSLPLRVHLWEWVRTELCSNKMGILLIRGSSLIACLLVLLGLHWSWPLLLIWRSLLITWLGGLLTLELTLLNRLLWLILWAIVGSLNWLLELCLLDQRGLVFLANEARLTGHSRSLKLTLGKVLKLSWLDWYLVLSTSSLYWLHYLTWKRALLARRLVLSLLLHWHLLWTIKGWHNWILILALVLALMLEWHLIWATGCLPCWHNGISVFTCLLTLTALLLHHICWCYSFRMHAWIILCHRLRNLASKSTLTTHAIGLLLSLHLRLLLRPW